MGHSEKEHSKSTQWVEGQSATGPTHTARAHCGHRISPLLDHTHRKSTLWAEGQSALDPHTHTRAQSGQRAVRYWTHTRTHTHTRAQSGQRAVCYWTHTFAHTHMYIHTETQITQGSTNLDATSSPSLVNDEFHFFVALNACTGDPILQNVRNLAPPPSVAPDKFDMKLLEKPLVFQVGIEGGSRHHNSQFCRI